METSQEEIKEEMQLPLDIYERMGAALYTYRFGTIGFLELLARFEEILGIETPQPDTQQSPKQQ